MGDETGRSGAGVVKIKCEAVHPRSAVATLLALIVALAAFPALGRERGACQHLTGPDRRECMHDEAVAQSEANRRAAEDRRAAMPTAAPGPSRAALPTPSAAGGVAAGRGGFSAGPKVLIDAAGRPVVVRGKGSALLTIVNSSGYTSREKRYTTPVARTCGGQSVSDASLIFDKACQAQTMRGSSVAQPMFQQSCDEGDPSGCYELTRYLGTKNRPQVLSLLKDACSNGHSRACSEMAEAYRIGDGVAKDTAQMRAYYELGCDVGSLYSCAWLQGKIDPECPHGFRSYRVDFNKHTYKVACVVPTGGISRTEYELIPSAAELVDMKVYGEYMRTHKATPVGEVLREALRGDPPDTRPCGPDSRGYDGKPIAGSGCAGRTSR